MGFISESTQAAKSIQKLSVPSIYHPFVFQSSVSIASETGAKIHVPPKSQSGAEEEIVITGDRDAVRRAAGMLSELVSELQATTTTMKVSIPKKQHRYLLGAKGINLSDILEKTGCAVEVPAAEVTGNEGEEVVVRGPSNRLVEAVTMVLEKVGLGGTVQKQGMKE